MRNLQTVQVRTGSSFERICPFPVGYIYMSSNSTSPANIYGGTWSALSDSRFLRPSGSWNSTGGSAQLYAQIFAGGNSSWGYIYQNWSENYPRWDNNQVSSIGAIETRGQSNTAGVAVRGTTDNSNALPPYRTCYCWYRTA